MQSGTAVPTIVAAFTGEVNVTMNKREMLEWWTDILPLYKRARGERREFFWSWLVAMEFD